MAYLVADKDGVEYIFQDKPVKSIYGWISYDTFPKIVRLPNGSIKKLIGFDLTFDDNFVEI